MFKQMVISKHLAKNIIDKPISQLRSKQLRPQGGETIERERTVVNSFSLSSAIHGRLLELSFFWQEEHPCFVQIWHQMRKYSVSDIRVAANTAYKTEITSSYCTYFQINYKSLPSFVQHCLIAGHSSEANGLICKNISVWYCNKSGFTNSFLLSSLFIYKHVNI